MKRFLIIVAAVMASMQALALSSGRTDGDNEKHITAFINYATFYHPTVGPYVETYISFDAWNLNFKKQGSEYQATVEVIITLSKEDSIEWVKKYDLQSPKIASLDKDRFSFLDVQREAVSNGIHDLTIQLHDKNSSDAATVTKLQLPVLYTDKRTTLSSVQMMSTVKPTTTMNILSRNGYDMEPYVSDFLPEQVDQIHFYYEIYNIDRETRNDKVYSVCYIETLETAKMLEWSQTIQALDRAPLIPVFTSLDISQLPSGNYNLVVEVRNKNNDLLLFKRLPFFRSNPSLTKEIEQMPVEATFAGQIQDEMKLNDYIEALAPIANESERSQIYTIIYKPGLKEKQQFLYTFWCRREPLSPDKAWMEYRDRIDYVNAHFSWPRTKGYQTDRGRVYLQYGAPDYVRDEKNFVSMRLGSGVKVNQSSSDQSFQVVDLNPPSQGGQTGQVFYLPYQLWRYNNLPGDDAKRCFIFWDEFRNGFYKLLHSNAKGEVRDAKWEQRLSQQQLNEDVVGEVGEQFERGY
jgi:GWxTD domain-containing protein